MNSNSFFLQPALAIVLLAPAAWGQTWDGSSNTNWNIKQNWSPASNVPTATETAIFSALTINQPVVSANTSVGGISFAAAGTVLTINSGNTLTVGATGTTASLNTTITGGGTLSSALSVTGGTYTINSGTAMIGGNATVSNGATLALNGTMSNALTVSGNLVGSGSHSGAVSISSGGTHSAGTNGTVGTHTFSNTLNYNAGSIFSWDVTSATTFDKVTVGALSGSSAVFNIVTNINAPFWNNDQTFIGIFTSATNLSGIFSSIRLNGSTLTNGVATGRGTFSFDGANLKYTAIPEPTSALAGILLVGGLLRRRR